MEDKENKTVPVGTKVTVKPLDPPQTNIDIDKSLEDAICIYVISHYPKEESINPYEYCTTLKGKFLDILKTKNRRKINKNVRENC